MASINIGGLCIPYTLSAEIEADIAKASAPVPAAVPKMRKLIRKPVVIAAPAPVAVKAKRPKYVWLSYHKGYTLNLEGKPLSSLWEGVKVTKKPIWDKEYPDDRRHQEFDDIRDALYFYGLGNEWEQMMTDLFGDPCKLEREPHAGHPDWGCLRPAPANGLSIEQKGRLIREAVESVSSFSGSWS